MARIVIAIIAALIVVLLMPSTDCTGMDVEQCNRQKAIDIGAID